MQSSDIALAIQSNSRHIFSVFMGIDCPHQHAESAVYAVSNVVLGMQVDCRHIFTFSLSMGTVDCHHAGHVLHSQMQKSMLSLVCRATADTPLASSRAQMVCIVLINAKF